MCLRCDGLKRQWTFSMARLPMHLAAAHVANAIAEKGARIKLKQRGEERGIAGTIPEIYAIDKEVTLTADDLKPVREHVAGDVRTGYRIARARLSLIGYVCFELDPSVFEDSDPSYPTEHGGFEDLTYGNKKTP